jgi:hypothetical protein
MAGGFIDDALGATAVSSIQADISAMDKNRA